MCGHVRSALVISFFFPVTWIMFLPPLLCSLSVQPLLFVACQEIPRTMPYTKGMQIEVSKVENDSVVAWLPAVVAKNIWKNNLLVEYTVSKSGGIALSEEIVDVKHVRPCPPQASAISFCINDEVEAFQGGGWWLGVITEVHPELKYTIKSIHLGVRIHRTLGPRQVGPTYCAAYCAEYSNCYSVTNLSSDMLPCPADSLTKGGLLLSSQQGAHWGNVACGVTC